MKTVWLFRQDTSTDELILIPFPRPFDLHSSGGRSWTFEWDELDDFHRWATEHVYLGPGPVTPTQPKRARF